MTTIKKVLDKHLITYQNELQDSFLEDFDNPINDYRIEQPKVILNPYNISPLTALVMFYTERACEITLTIHGKEERGNITHTFASTKRHILPVYGLYINDTTKLTLTSSHGHRVELSITTEPAETPLPELVHIEEKDQYLQDDWIFLSPTSKHAPVAIDCCGDIRWYLTTNISFDLKRLKNGNLLVGTDRLIQLPYFITGLYEMSLTGKIFKEYRMAGGYHHDTQELSDGNLLVLSQGANAETVEDHLNLIDRESGQVIRYWDFKDYFPKEVIKGSGSQSKEDWCHSNAVAYDEELDECFISARHMDVVFVLSLKEDRLKYVIGDPTGWDPDFVEKYFFQAIGEDFEWQYEQHGVQITPEKNIMLFDNGQYRAKNAEDYLPNKDNYSRGVIYELERENRTIRQLYQYGKERGADFFSAYICNIEYYEKDRYMIHSGGIGYYNGEILTKGLPTYPAGDLKADDVDMRSITVELLDNQVMFELQLEGNFYRAERLPAYYAKEEFVSTTGQILGKLAESEIMDTYIPYTETNEVIPEDYQAILIEQADRYILQAIFQPGELALLVLKSNQEERQYFISTAVQGDAKAMCVATFINDDPRQKELIVNKIGLEGTYDVYLNLDGKLYETGHQISG